MADYIGATPQNPLLGLLYGGYDYLRSPQRTQQMQGLASLLESTGIPKTIERMSYGEPLTNIGQANVPLLKPETAEAMMTVAPMAGPAARATAKGVQRAGGLLGSQINRAMLGEGGLLAPITPQPMFAVSPINLKKGIYKPELTMEEMLKVKDIPTVDRVKQSIDLVGEKEFKKMVDAQYKKYKPTDQDQEAMLVESVTLDILGKAQRSPYPQEQALRTAQENAATLGQSAKQETRMLQQGYYPDWYHGSTGDITNFRPDLLGEATGAASAKKAYFFARDPQNPPAGLLQKTTDQESIDLLKRLGKTDKEIAALNAVSMEGNAAQTASGYAQIGGSREYREAMRKANAAEKRKDWNEYEKQMQIAEDSEINRMNYAQGLVAKYGDARDEMLRAINENTIYSKKLPQAELELLDAKYKELMPYGWYNTYEPKQFQELKKELVNLVGKESAAPALKKIDDFMSVKAERMISENTQEGGNVLPVALRYKNPMVYDFAGSSYRDQSYSDLIDQAMAGGHDALIMKNTYDPASGPSKLIDVGAVFSPDQIRSHFAAFDPFRKDVATATAMGVALPDLLASPVDQQRQQPNIQDLIDYGLLSP